MSESDLPPKGDRRPARGRVWRRLYQGAVLALIALNTWWLVRDLPEPASLATIRGWVANGRYELAAPALRARLRRSPHDVPSRVLLAEVLAARGELRAAVREYRAVPNWSPLKPEALVREGELSWALDRARDAEAAWKAVLRDDPLHPVPPELRQRAARGLAGLYGLEGREADVRALRADGALVSDVVPPPREEAVARLRRLVAADPGDVEARRALGRAQAAGAR